MLYLCTTVLYFELNWLKRKNTHQAKQKQQKQCAYDMIQKKCTMHLYWYNLHQESITRTEVCAYARIRRNRSRASGSVNSSKGVDMSRVAPSGAPSLRRD